MPNALVEMIIEYCISQNLVIFVLIEHYECHTDHLRIFPPHNDFKNSTSTEVSLVPMLDPKEQNSYEFEMIISITSEPFTL